MPSILDTIRAALKRPKPTTEQMAGALDLARRAQGEAAADVEHQVATVAAGYLDPEDKRAAARSKLADLRAVAEDAGLILAEAERRYAAAVAAEEEAARLVIYQGAKEKADAAALALSKTYPTLARGIVAMLRDLAEAQAAVGVANADLPAGAEPIADPEFAARGVIGQPREIVSEEEVVAWCNVFSSANPVPIPDEQQARIVEQRDGWGQAPGTHRPFCRRHRFVKRTVRPATYADGPSPLAASIQLPAVKGSGFVWEATPTLAAFNMDAADVLNRVAALDAEAVARPTKAARPAKVEWEDLGEVTTAGLDKEEPAAYEAVRTKPAPGSRFAASPSAQPGSRPARRA